MLEYLTYPIPLTKSYGQFFSLIISRLLADYKSIRRVVPPPWHYPLARTEIAKS